MPLPTEQLKQYFQQKREHREKYLRHDYRYGQLYLIGVSLIHLSQLIFFDPPENIRKQKVTECFQVDQKRTMEENRLKYRLQEKKLKVCKYLRSFSLYHAVLQ